MLECVEETQECLRKKAKQSRVSEDDGTSDWTHAFSKV